MTFATDIRNTAAGTAVEYGKYSRDVAVQKKPQEYSQPTVIHRMADTRQRSEFGRSQAHRIEFEEHANEGRRHDRDHCVHQAGLPAVPRHPARPRPRPPVYRIVDLAEDPDARDYLLALGHLAAPVVTAGAEHWSGYRPDRVHAMVAATA